MNTFIKKLWALAALALPLLTVQSTVNAQNGNYIDESIYENLPFNMPKVEHPAFPDYTVNIVDFGAKGDGIVLNTKAINDAIKAVNAKGGGKVIIPEGFVADRTYRVAEQRQSIYREERLGAVH